MIMFSAWLQQQASRSCRWPELWLAVGSWPLFNPIITDPADISSQRGCRLLRQHQPCCDACFCYRWWWLPRVTTQINGGLRATTGGCFLTSCCIWQIIALAKRCVWFWCAQTSQRGWGNMSDDSGRCLMSKRRAEGCGAALRLIRPDRFRT